MDGSGCCRLVPVVPDKKEILVGAMFLIWQSSPWLRLWQILAIFGAGMEGSVTWSTDDVGAVLTASTVPVGSVLVESLAVCCRVIFPSPPVINRELPCGNNSERFNVCPGADEFVNNICFGI